jgi:hypothetical protein
MTGPGPTTRTGEVLTGLFRFMQAHPSWSDKNGGEDGWDAEVAWWAVATSVGMVIIDPLVEDWEVVDELMSRHGSCAAVVRTCFWHQRSAAEAANRYGSAVWAMPPPTPAPSRPFDHAIASGQELPGGLLPFSVARFDEVVIWLPEKGALVSGDVLGRGESGELRMCPDSWLAPGDGPKRVRAALRALPALPVEHVLVSHGPMVLGTGQDELAQLLT